MNDLQMTAIGKSYKGPTGKVRVLSDLSLTLPAGNVHAVLGPSGCGKSTLLMICGGLIRPDSGTITIGDTNIQQLSARERARQQAELVGFVFQQFHLMPYLNIEQNIKASCLARTVRDADSRCDALIDRLGLSHRRGHTPAKLSSGEKQRVALARALINRPRCLIADEPTGNLDADTTAELLVLFREFADEGGLVLLATHEREVADFADQRFTFTNGQFSQGDGGS